MPERLVEWVAFFLGLGATLLLGVLVPYLMRSSRLNLPPEIDPETRGRLEEAMTYGEMQGQNSGRTLGVIERILFFASIWLEAYSIIGGWLIFKVGSKWATWQHIIQVPRDNLVGDDPLLNLRIRSAFGSYQMGRFLVGTFSNVLFGLVGVFFGKACIKLLPLTCLLCKAP